VRDPPPRQQTCLAWSLPRANGARTSVRRKVGKRRDLEISKRRSAVSVFLRDKSRAPGPRRVCAPNIDEACWLSATATQRVASAPAAGRKDQHLKPKAVELRPAGRDGERRHGRARYIGKGGTEAGGFLKGGAAGLRFATKRWRRSRKRRRNSAASARRQSGRFSGNEPTRLEFSESCGRSDSEAA
jgi:hypothetical protein